MTLYIHPPQYKPIFNTLFNKNIMDRIQLGSIKIFANKGTNEKVATFCSRAEARDIQIKLNRNYGGSWVWVENLEVNEILKFSDNTEYKGFHGKDERYSDIIEPLT